MPVNRVIWGRVLDADSNAAVAGARVSLMNDGVKHEVAAAVTTTDGRFNVSGATLGAWSVVVTRDGYATVGYVGESSDRRGYDFTGDVALTIYREFVIRTGQSVEMRIFNEAGASRCGPESWHWCRRVIIVADGRPVDVAVTADDPVLLTENPYYQDWNRDYAHESVATSAGGPLWIVRRFSFYGDPPVHVRLTVRPR